jgi:hypothetical protein
MSTIVFRNSSSEVKSASVRRGCWTLLRPCADVSERFCVSATLVNLKCLFLCLGSLGLLVILVRLAFES